MLINYDFDASLKLSNVLEDFFFSPSTGLYVSRHPLVVDERLLNAADKLGIRVQASPEKWLVITPLSDCLRILSELGSGALSLPEYFQVKKDTLRDPDMLSSLESDTFIEMLATVFENDRVMIHHPFPQGIATYTGTCIPITTPVGRYGWVHPADIDLETGLPTRVVFERNLDDDTIKYWDTHTDIGRDGTLMAVRGYVTSVGKMSLDLGYPADAISKKMCVRECKRTKPIGALGEEVLKSARGVLDQYYHDLENKTVYSRVPPWLGELLALTSTWRTELAEAEDLASRVIREDILDIFGIISSYASSLGDTAVLQMVKDAATSFFRIQQDNVTDEGFRNYMRGRKAALDQALAAHGSIVFVMGHNNPDTDTVVSAIAEAYRQHLMRTTDTVFIPVVPGKSLPLEIRELLGPEMSDALVYTHSGEYGKAVNSGRPEWIMVDHNTGAEQPHARSIIDHHFPSPVAVSQQIPRKIVFAGSTSSLVAQKLYGLGIEIPEGIARMIHGATLMDTENRFLGKMTPLDSLIMDRLSMSSGIVDEGRFYGVLMKKLVSCTDANELFVRDYKEDWGFFGFAVAKGIGLLDGTHYGTIDSLVELAHNNNMQHNLPLTLVKVVDYVDDAETISKERLYPVFSAGATEDFIAAVHAAVTTVIRHESGERVLINQGSNYIEYSGVGTQLSRKKLAPVVDQVVQAFNRYFYSPSTGLYFKRDFLRRSDLDRDTRTTLSQQGIEPHASDEGVVVGNPAELKYILQLAHLRCATPAEYFGAYFDAITARDSRMVTHLTSTVYLETLNAIIENKGTLVEDPHIYCTDSGYSYDGGVRSDISIPEGNPGLFEPAKVNRSTGIPMVVEDPRQYGTNLWRYWGPGSRCDWVLRSSIFAYDMPALDMKFRFDEALPRLAIRPCVAVAKNPSVRVYESDNVIAIDIVD